MSRNRLEVQYNLLDDAADWGTYPIILRLFVNRFDLIGCLWFLKNVIDSFTWFVFPCHKQHQKESKLFLEGIVQEGYSLPKGFWNRCILMCFYDSCLYVFYVEPAGRPFSRFFCNSLNIFFYHQDHCSQIKNLLEMWFTTKFSWKLFPRSKKKLCYP